MMQSIYGKYKYDYVWFKMESENEMEKTKLNKLALIKKKDFGKQRLNVT